MSVEWKSSRFVLLSNIFTSTASLAKLLTKILWQLSEKMHLPSPCLLFNLSFPTLEFSFCLCYSHLDTYLIQNLLFLCKVLACNMKNNKIFKFSFPSQSDLLIKRRIKSSMHPYIVRYLCGRFRNIKY